MAALELAVARDHLVGHPPVERGDHLHATRPILRGEDPLDAALVAVGHAHESTTPQGRLTAREVPETQLASHQRMPDVVVVPVGQELHVVEPDRVRALDAQFQHEPVGQVDQVLVVHRATTQDRGLAVEAAVGVGARVVDGPRVLPLGRPSGAEIAVAGRGQRLTQALGRGVEPVVGECDVLHGIPSERHPARSTPERVRNCSTSVVAARTRSAPFEPQIVNKRQRRLTDVERSSCADLPTNSKGTALLKTTASRANRRTGWWKIAHRVSGIHGVRKTASEAVQQRDRLGPGGQVSVRAA